MGDKYRFVGSVAPDSRPDRVEVEPATAEDPAVVLELDENRLFEGTELSPEQVDKLSQYIILERVTEPVGEDLDLMVDQPLAEPRASTSTAGFIGTTPDLESLDRQGLLDEVSRVRGLYGENAVPNAKGNSSKDEIKSALSEFYATHEV